LLNSNPPIAGSWEVVGTYLFGIIYAQDQQ